MSSVRISAQIRMFVADRANHCCEYCKLPNRYFGAFTIDHVIPTSKGRDSNPQNLASNPGQPNSILYLSLSSHQR